MSNDTVDISVVNDQISSSLRGGDPMVKVAADLTSNYIRLKLRESMFNGKIIPIKPITPEEFGTDERDKPFFWLTLEPASPAAVMLTQDGAAPIVPYYARKMRVQFMRFGSPRYRKSTDTLLTYKDIDLRAVMADIGINEVGKRKDWAFMSLCEAAVSSAGNAPVQFTGGFTRANWMELSKIMIRHSLEPATCLLTKTTAIELAKLDRVSVGGDLAQDIFKAGYSAIPETVGGLKMITTIKSDIVADNVVWQFAAPNYLGVNREWQKDTMYLEREVNNITMSIVSQTAMAIANTNGVSKAVFFNNNGAFKNTRYPLEAVNNTSTKGVIPAYTLKA